MMMDSWKFGIKQVVTLETSGEQGTVVGRAEYAHDERKYLVRYKAGDGRQVESWWGESALIAA